MWTAMGGLKSRGGKRAGGEHRWTLTGRRREGKLEGILRETEGAVVAAHDEVVL